MKLINKFLLALLICVSIFTFVSCREEEPQPEVPVTLTVKSDKMAYFNGATEPDTEINLSIDEISEPVSDSLISWYVNDELKGTGNELTLTTPTKDETGAYKLYEVYAVATKNGIGYESDHVYYSVTDYTNLDDIVSSFMTDNSITTGVSVAVYSKTHCIDFKTSKGLSSLKNSTQNTDSTYHPICSLTKSFTGAAISKLVHDGNLSLDAKVGDLLNFGDLNINRSKINADATVKELLEHRSGISEFVGSDIMLDMLCYYNNVKFFLALTSHSYPYSDGWKPEIVLNYATANIAEKDGDSYPYIYSSLNYVLLGMIVEDYLTENPSTYPECTTYESFVRKYLMDPIGIGATDIIMAPRETKDDFDWDTVASPHFNPDGYSDYITSGMSLLLTFLGISSGDNDLIDIIPDAQKMLCQTAWAGGGFLGTARPAALWIYNLMSDKGLEDFSQVKEDVDNDSVDDSYGIVYNDGNGEYYHNGQGVGTWNRMSYFENTDVAVVILTDTTVSDSYSLKSLAVALSDVFKTE